MQKKIIALAIASAMTVPALAYADATVYGQANISYDITNDGAASDATANYVQSNQSRIGFKGSEDLGGGLSAVWQMEGNVGVDTGTTNSTANSGLFDRNTYLGLKGDSWGTVLAGRHDTPYKSSTRKLDLFADSAADNRAIMGTNLSAQGVFDARSSNQIVYISPDMGGMSAAAGYVSSEATAGATQNSTLSLAGMYNAAGIYGTVAYQSNATKQATGAGVADTTDTALKFGGSYTMDQITVGAVYEMAKDEAAALLVKTETKQNNFHLNGKFAISSTDAVKLAYTKGGDKKVGGSTTSNSGATQLSLGYDHGMSKNTSVYALYTSLKRGLNAGAYTTYSGLGTTADKTSSVISVGMKHAF